MIPKQMNKSTDYDKIHSQISDYIQEEILICESTSREEDAIRKMSCLKTCEFLDLLVDVKDEICRRTSENYPVKIYNPEYSAKRNVCRRKISKLSEKKFRNILLDVFIVYRHRFPDGKNEDASKIQDLISELASLVINLKNESKIETIVMKNIEAEKNYKGKILMYNKYVRTVFEKHKIDLTVIDYMNSMFADMPDFSNCLLEMLLNPQDFVNETNNFFESKPQDVQTEYQYYAQNIHKLLDENFFESKTRNRLISRNISAILELMYANKDDKSSSEVVNIEPEINTIIMNLEALKAVMQSKESKEEYFTIATSVLNVVSMLQKKMKNLPDIENTFAIKLLEEKKNLQFYIDEKSHDNIPKVIFDLAQLVKSILYAMPLGTPVLDRTI